MATSSVLWAELSAEVLSERAAQNAVVLIPVASTEQHGPHLPTGVDTALCNAVCRKTAERLTGSGHATVVLPPLAVGMAEHHMSFGGTLTFTLSTYTAVLTDICCAITRHGFSKLLIVNGHGGNIFPLGAMMPQLADAAGVPIPAVTYFALAQSAFAEILEDQTGVRHAGEAETSMMMALHPELVDEARLTEAFGGPAGALRNPTPPVFARHRFFSEMTQSGVLGDARRATAAKGERLLEVAAKTLADAIASGDPWA